MRKHYSIPKVTAWITDMNKDPSSPKKANATVQIGHLLYISDISIYEGSGPGGPYITLPRRQTIDKDGKTTVTETVRCASHAMRKAITEACLLSYQNAKNMSAQSDK